MKTAHYKGESFPEYEVKRFRASRSCAKKTGCEVKTEKRRNYARLFLAQYSGHFPEIRLYLCLSICWKGKIRILAFTEWSKSFIYRKISTIYRG
mgnify:CR=1 FL=1